MKKRLCFFILSVFLAFLFYLVIERILFINDKTLTETKPVYAVIRINKNDNLNNLQQVKELYLGNNLSPTPALVKDRGTYLEVLIEGEGHLKEDSFYIASQKLSLNQKIAIRGLVEGEGIVVEVGNDK